MRKKLKVAKLLVRMDRFTDYFIPLFALLATIGVMSTTLFPDGTWKSVTITTFSGAGICLSLWVLSNWYVKDLKKKFWYTFGFPPEASQVKNSGEYRDRRVMEDYVNRTLYTLACKFKKACEEQQQIAQINKKLKEKQFTIFSEEERLETVKVAKKKFWGAQNLAWIFSLTKLRKIKGYIAYGKLRGWDV